MLSAIHAFSTARTSSSFDVATDEGPADAARENERQATVAHLLVGAHVLEQPVRRSATAREEPRVDRQAGDREVPADTTNVVGGGEAEAGREVEGQDVPMATASPCSRASPNPVSASSA